MVHYSALNCLKCLQGVTICTPNHHQTPAELFFRHLAVVWHPPPALAGNQPSLGGPVVFRYFSWLVELLTRMADFGRQQPLQQVHFQSSTQCTWSKWRTYDIHLATAGPNRKNTHFTECYNHINVILLVARGEVLKLDYSFILSVLMITSCRVWVISNLCPCCCKVATDTVPVT